jgi:ankyrin repeat protein
MLTFILKNECAFQLCCANGHIELAKLLAKLGVAIHANNEFAFRLSCEKGHIEIAKWLVELGVDIHAHNKSLLEELDTDIHVRNNYALQLNFAKWCFSGIILNICMSDG